MDSAERVRLRELTKPLLRSDKWIEIERLWKPFVEVDDIDAVGELGCMYEWNGFDEGPEKAQEMRGLLWRATARGHADATYCLATLAPLGKQRDELLVKAGELGNRAAQRDLGAYYATGNWTGPKDPVIGLQWYSRAAELGEDDAQYNLGFMYILGEGTTADVNRGLLWLQRSAEQGHTGAMRLLSDLYTNGYYGVPLDANEAERWERRLHEAEKAQSETLS
jgi:TPR repeat protein